MNNNFLLIFIIAFLSTISGCVQSQPINWDFEDKLLYVEGASLTSGRFGDIILLDPILKAKQKITSDFHYDASPFLTKDGKSVIFLSKRRPNDKNHGLGKADDIYVYDILSREISEYFRDRKEYITSLLQIESSSNKVIYQQMDDSNKYIIYMTGRLDNSTDTLNTKAPYNNYEGMFFSKNRQYFVIQNMTRSGSFRHNTFYLYDKGTNEYYSILDKFNDSDFGDLKSTNCASGSFISENEFLFSCIVYRDKLSKIFKYNIDTEELLEIARSSDLYFENPISGKSPTDIYFLAREFGESIEEIWKFNIQENSFTKITNSGINKESLRVY